MGDATDDRLSVTSVDGVPSPNVFSDEGWQQSTTDDSPLTLTVTVTENDLLLKELDLSLSANINLVTFEVASSKDPSKFYTVEGVNVSIYIFLMLRLCFYSCNSFTLYTEDPHISLIYYYQRFICIRRHIHGDVISKYYFIIIVYDIKSFYFLTDIEYEEKNN